MDGHAPLSIRAGDGAGACSRLGRVVASNGSQAIIILDASEAGADNPGLQIGALVKIPTSHSHVFALVNGLAIPMPKSLGEAELKMVEIELLGECVLGAAGGLGPFQRGVSIAPGLGDSVFAASSSCAIWLSTALRNTSGAASASSGKTEESVAHARQFDMADQRVDTR